MSLDLQPILVGTHLRLRPVRAEDFDGLFVAASDSRIWEQHPQPTRYQREVFQKYFDGALASKGALVAEELASGALVGSSRYYDFHAAERRVSVGYTFLVCRCWGGAFNRDMKSLMLAHAFGAVEEVHFEVGETNYRSQTAIERMGAVLRDRRILDGNPHRLYVIKRREVLRSG